MEKTLKTNSTKAGGMPANKMQEYLNMFGELKTALYDKCVALLKEKMPKAALKKYEKLNSYTQVDNIHSIVMLLQKADIADLYGVRYPALVDCNRALRIVKHPGILSDAYLYKLNRVCADALCFRAGLEQKHISLRDLTDAISIIPRPEYYQQRSQILPDTVPIPLLIKLDKDRGNKAVSAIVKRQPAMETGEVFKKAKRKLNIKYSKSWETHDPYFKFRLDIGYDLQNEMIEKYFGKNKWQASDFYLQLGIEYLDESRYTEATRSFSNSIKIKPDQHFVYWLRAQSKALSGNGDGAVMDLLTCFLLDPKSTFDNYIYALSDSAMPISFLQAYRWAEEVYFSSPQDEYWQGHPMISAIRRMDENDRLVAEAYIIDRHMDVGERRFAPATDNVGFYNLLVKYKCEDQFLLLHYITNAIDSIFNEGIYDSNQRETNDKIYLLIGLLTDRSRLLSGINEDEVAFNDLQIETFLGDTLGPDPTIEESRKNKPL